MSVTVTRGTGTADEAAIDAVFAAEGLRPQRWSNGPGDVYAVHEHGYHKVLYCLAGSIVFRLAETDESADLHPGDRLDVPLGTAHSAVVGPQGVTCVEAPRA